MKATIRLVTKVKITKKGYPIRIDIAHGNNRKRYTFSHSNKEHWDSIKGLPLPAHPNYAELYGNLVNIKARALSLEFGKMTDCERAYVFLIDMPVTSLEKVQLYDYWQKDINMLRDAGRDGNADAVRDAMNSWKTLFPSLTWGDIGMPLFEQYKNVQLSVVSHTTIKNYLAVLRYLYNKAVRQGVVPDKGLIFKGAFTGLTVRKRRRRNFYVKDKYLRRMESPKKNYGLTMAQQRALDLSLLQFYLGGVNLKDLWYLKWEQWQDVRIWFIRSKLGNKGEWFDVKAFAKAEKLIRKYAVKGGEYVFPWIKTHEGYKNARGNHNDDLKEVQKKMKIKLSPVDGKLTSNVMRHTFATRAKFLHIDPDIIRELMGHERNDVDTIYKDKYPQKVRDAAHLRIITF